MTTTHNTSQTVQTSVSFFEHLRVDDPDSRIMVDANIFASSTPRQNDFMTFKVGSATFYLHGSDGMTLEDVLSCVHHSVCDLADAIAVKRDELSALRHPGIGAPE